MANIRRILSYEEYVDEKKAEKEKRTNPVTIQELIAVLEQQKKTLGPNFIPTILVEEKAMDQWRYVAKRLLIEEVATEDGDGLAVVHLYAQPERSFAERGDTVAQID